MYNLKFKMSIYCLLMALPVILFAGIAYGDAEVTLAWDPNSESDLAGYRLYSRLEAEPNYNFDLVLKEIPAGTETCTVFLAEENAHVYFVLTAFDVHGNEGDVSNEVSCFIDTIKPAPPQALAITKVVRY